MAVVTRHLVNAGNTVRLDGQPGTGSSIQLILVAGDGLASQWWLNVLALARRPMLRLFITRADLETVMVARGRRAPSLHVQPSVAPSFLVCCDGWIVDWFPAPLPSATGSDPTRLLEAVESRVAVYLAAAVRRGLRERTDEAPVTLTIS